MAKKIYLSQIQAKIDRLQRERKQVLEHLTLVEDKLNKLQAAIEIMQEEALTDEYNTDLYTYQTHTPFQRQVTPNGTGRDEGSTKL